MYMGLGGAVLLPLARGDPTLGLRAPSERGAGVIDQTGVMDKTIMVARIPSIWGRGHG